MIKRKETINKKNTVIQSLSFLLSPDPADTTPIYVRVATSHENLAGFKPALFVTLACNCTAAIINNLQSSMVKVRVQFK